MTDRTPGCPSPEQLEHLLDEALDAPARQSVAEHVAACSCCQAALERLTADDPASPATPSLGSAAGPSEVDDDRPADGFLERLKRFPEAPGDGLVADPEPGAVQVPGYEILQELGRGGMGVVYKARQVSLGRLVTLKMVLAGPHAGGKDLARFRQEAEAVAQLRHPNIVQIYDIGEAEGRPYLALEYVEGGSLVRRLQEELQPAELVASLVETVARAIHFAHQHHIVHRDLKPANILLSPRAPLPFARSGRPPSGFALGAFPARFPLEYFEPKITDFGLAKRLDEQSSKTQSGEILGTPSYMAPEQAKGKVGRIGPATDVYALGAVLYELLTGRPPFNGATPVDTLVQILHEEPLRPARLRPGLPADLETICLKCLEKEPGRRYGSALALAEDLHRFRKGRPILARPVGRLERGWKWARHRPLIASLMTAVVLLTVAGFGAVTWHWRSAANAWAQTEDARKRTALEREKVKAALYYSLIAEAQLQWRVNDPVSAERTLARCIPEPGQRDRRGWEWHYLHGIFHADLLTLDHGGPGPGAGVLFQPQGRWIASVVGGHANRSPSPRAEVKIWDPVTGAVVRTFSVPSGVHRLAVRPDGRRLALAAVDGTVLVYDPLTGKELLRRRHHADMVAAIAYSPDGSLLASASWDETVRVWDGRTGDVRHVLKGHRARVQSVSFHPTADRLASGGWDGTARVWDAATGKELQTLPGHRSAVYGVAYSPDGRLLASAGSNGNIKIWQFGSAKLPEAEAGRVVQSLTGHAGSVLSLAFSPDGRSLAYGAGDATVRLWDVEDGVERTTLRGHTGPVEGLAFSPDGQRLASVSPDQGVVKVWDLTRHPEYANFARTGPGPHIEALAFSEQGKTLVSFTAGGKLQSWDVTTGVLQDEHALSTGGPTVSPTTLASFDPAARRLAAREPDDWHRVKVWDVRTGALLLTLGGHAFPVCCVRFSGDGRLLATGACDLAQPEHPNEIRIWDGRDGRPLVQLKDRGRLYAAAFHPAGRWLVVAGEQGRLLLVPCTGQPGLRAIAGHRGNVTALAFSPDGEYLVSAAQGEGGVRLWRFEDLVSTRGESPAPLQILATPDNLYDLAFSPDGTRLAGISRDLVRLWDVGAGQEVLTLRGAPQRHWDPPFNPRLAFSPDGVRLAGTNWDESISMWSADDRTTGADPSSGRRALRRRAADRRAVFWHLQEAEHCLDRQNRSGALFHFRRIRDLPLPAPLQARKERLAGLLAGSAPPE